MVGTGEATKTNNERDDSEQPVDHFRKKLTESGSGGGVSLHFDAGFAAEYGLDPDTEVDVQVIEEQGDVKFRVGNIPAGFSYDELREFADTQNWNETDRYVDADEWYLTYRNNAGTVRIELDSKAKINGSLVNNVIVQSNPIHITGNLERYNRLCATAQRKDLRVRVNDNQGLWQRLRSASDHDTDDAPDEDTFEQLTQNAEEVTAQLVCERSSVHTTLAELKEIVNKTEDAYASLNPE